MKNKIKELRNLTSNPDWDDERANAIPDQQWNIVAELILAIGEDNVYDVSPCGDGYIHLMFYRYPHKGLLEVGIKKSFWTDYNVTEFAGIYPTELISLDEALPLIKRFCK